MEAAGQELFLNHSLITDAQELFAAYRDHVENLHGLDDIIAACLCLAAARHGVTAFHDRDADAEAETSSVLGGATGDVVTVRAAKRPRDGTDDTSLPSLPSQVLAPEAITSAAQAVSAGAAAALVVGPEAAILGLDSTSAAMIAAPVPAAAASLSQEALVAKAKELASSGSRMARLGARAKQFVRGVAKT